jgi:hypothetical protein
MGPRQTSRRYGVALTSTEAPSPGRYGLPPFRRIWQLPGSAHAETSRRAIRNISG